MSVRGPGHLLRMGRLPEAWIAPPACRELRGWVRHRAKLVGLRSNLKCQVHAVLAGAGVWASRAGALDGRVEAQHLVHRARPVGGCLAQRVELVAAWWRL